MRPPGHPSFPPEVLAELEAALQRGAPTDAELQQVADAAAGRYNDAPQADLGGLSPNQLAALLDTDWVSAGEPLRLNQRLTPGDLAQSPLFHNARTILASLRDDGPLGATATGNLNRAAVATLLPRLKLDAEMLSVTREMSKVINEPNIFALYELRITLQGLGLIYRRKGFRITARGGELLSDLRAGTLFGMLFMGSVVNPPFEPPASLRADAMFTALPFAIRALAGQPAEWRPAAELAESVWPPFVGDKLARDAGSGFWTFESALVFLTSAVLLDPLVNAGLLERRVLRPGSWRTEYKEFRATPLFRKALEFA